MVGAIPVALAVALVTQKPSFAIRKEAKDHGVGGRIAGVLEAGPARADRGGHRDHGEGARSSRCPRSRSWTARSSAVSLLLDRGGALGGKLADRGIPYVPVLGAPDVGYEFGS